MGIKTDGFDDLLEYISMLMKRADSRRVAARALGAGCEVILEDMKRRTTQNPQIRTGDLHNALQCSGANLTAKRKYMTVGVHRRDWEKRQHKPTKGENYYYPAYVEYGHGGPAPAGPHPYIRIAFDENHGEAYAEMKRVLREELFK